MLTSTGPIIRINPWELHVNDPEYYDTLYAGAGKKRDKYLYYTEQFGNPESMIGTISHKLHRMRRAPLGRFFSKASVTQLEPLIQATIDKLVARLRLYQEAKKPVKISLAYACLTNDVVCEYSFGMSDNLVETSQDFRTDIHDALENVSKVSHILKQVPWLIPTMQKVPLGVSERDLSLFASTDSHTVGHENPRPRNTLFYAVPTSELSLGIR